MIEVDKAGLYLNNSRESNLALQYIQQKRLNPDIHYTNYQRIEQRLHNTTPLFSNSSNEPLLPTLITYSWKYISPFSFISFSGVKSFLRGKVLFELRDNEPFWRDVKTFYPEQEYDPKSGFREKQNLVTCFNRKKEKIFEGRITEAPYPLKEVLDEHDYKAWYEVSCREIGEIEKLKKKQNKKGMIIDKSTLTTLFPDEIEKLERGERITTTDSRSIYHVTYEAYFRSNGTLYELYAHMQD